MSSSFAQSRLRDYEIRVGVLPSGAHNAITDVDGVRVGHTTIIKGDNICTGVTAILPHEGNIFQDKVPGAIYVGNGFGKLAGVTQVQELGTIETPIILTNTLSVGRAVEAVVRYVLTHPGNESVKSVNALVGETNDGYLNDIRGMHVSDTDVMNAIKSAQSGPVPEGSVGAGTGTVAFGYKGGIGTASRVLPQELGGYTVGVLVQTNFGGDLKVAGYPVGKELGTYPYSRILHNGDGSCMIVVATDAPVDSRNLERMAKRAMLGLARTGGYASNGSGDYVVAFSTKNRIPYETDKKVLDQHFLHNDAMSPLFLAVVESAEEAILNALFMATIPSNITEDKIRLAPVNRIVKMLLKAGLIEK